MKYGSVCSGIEAASVAWHPLGWEAQWFSEIEPFPSAVLAHRFPNAPNLGDMTKIHEHEKFKQSTIDVLVGGTPCQSFSVAGLRKGLDDPRGNLMLTFLKIADIKRPKWIVWENVPGVLSSNNGKDFKCFLDSLEELRYICDVEILDAQFFGVAQRRRRVFVCAQNADYLISQKTISSALTISQCLLEILHSILRETLSLYEREPLKLEQANLSKDGVKRRMSLFGILTENCNYKKLQENLIEVFRKHTPVQKSWELPLGEKSEKEVTLEDLLMGLTTEGQSILTEELLKKALEGLYEVMKLYITSTLTRQTIQSKISTFFTAGEAIGRLICRLSESSPNSLSATLSFLTLQKELINYARQASGELFSELGGIHDWVHFFKQAKRTEKVIGYLGNWRPAAAVLFERHSLSGHPAPRREKREGAAGSVEGGVGNGGWPAEIASTLNAQYGDKMGLEDQHALNGAPLFVATLGHTQSNGLGITKTETANTLEATSSVNQAVAHAFKVRGGCEGGGKGYLGQDEAAFTISTGQDQMVAQPVAFAQNTRDEVREMSVVGALAASPGMKQTSYIRNHTAIRRLTPVECERLMGFPDNWTKIPYRNKPADQCPDGPRYKACGNSMAVPVMRWIGERIDKVENLMHELNLK